MSHIIVVGGGIVGTLSALLAARSGHDVTIVERAPELWSRASLVNEGKVHLGPVFALGNTSTHDLMLRGALAFADVVDQALETSVDWDRLAGDPFTYLVMPDSLATPDELRAVYSRINDRFTEAVEHSGDRYLGRRIDRIVDPTVRVDAGAGLPEFTTEELAVDPRQLGPLVSAAVHAHDKITVLTDTTATRLVHRADGKVDVVRDGAEPLVGDLVVNSTWEEQQAVDPDPVRQRHLNYRVKAAVIMEADFDARTTTLVQGPYGDVVRHDDYVYASWYPIGRRSNEHGMQPSDEARAENAGLASRIEVGEQQVVALQKLGMLPDHVRLREVIGGFIVGHGRADIDSPTSALHERSEFTVRHDRGVLTPVNFKLTTGPLAARETHRMLTEITSR